MVQAPFHTLNLDPCPPERSHDFLRNRRTPHIRILFLVVMFWEAVEAIQSQD